MSSKNLLRRFSASISDLLSIQRKNDISESRDEERSSCLHHAAQMGNAVMAQSLVENGVVSIDVEDRKGRTPLHYAVIQLSTEVASVLLKNGANVDCVDYSGITPAHLACRDGMIDAMKLLIYYKVDLTAVDNSGKTAFDVACENGRVKLVETLLESGYMWQSFRRASEYHKASALHLAARQGHVQICHCLLKCGWSLNRTTAHGSALHEAVAYGRLQTVRYLLHAGIDTHLKNANGLTVSELAKKTAARNPITAKEIRFLLKELRTFVYGSAVRTIVASSPNELSFTEGGIVWIIEQESSKETRWRGIVFGEKANSRIGYFPSAAVVLIAKPQTVIAMTSRIGRTGTHNTLRQVKKVAVPTIPDNAFELPSNDSKLNATCSDSMSDSRSTATGERVKRPSLLHLPSTSFSSNHSHHSGTISVCGSEESADCRSQLEYAMRGDDPSAGQLLGNPAASCYGPPLNAFSSNIHAQTYHRNSTGSNSSHASSGFESMQSGSLRSSAVSSHCNSTGSSSFFPSPSSQSYSSNAASEVCPPSRISMHSDGSGTSSLMHSSTDLIDESPYSNRLSRPSSTFPIESSSTSVADMVARGVPEAEIIALWLEKMKFSHYLSVFLTQGYDLASIARVTPEDLINLGITDPAHRKLLIADIHTWRIGDCWPNSMRPTDSTREWFTAIGLPEYINLFESQGCLTMRDVENLVWEDFEDIGVKKLGHMKRLTLAIKKLKNKRAETAIHHNVPMKNCVRTDMLAAGAMQRRNAPPPIPKRQGNIVNAGRDIYATFGRSSAPLAPHETDGHARRPVIQVPPTHRKVTTNEEPDETLKKSKKTAINEFEEPCKPIRLNLFSSEAILSNALKFEDMTISTHIDDYPPPPPAPLACEGSIRRLQSAFPSQPSSTYSNEPLPFANDNCGTIRSKGDRLGQSQPSTPRKCVQNVFSAAPRQVADDLGSNRQYEQGNDNRDFDLMIKNLNEELDAITADYPTLRTHDSSQGQSYNQRYSVVQRKF
ncbi:hypothetical protein QR680_002140 [Steinernema hermaphroditum]|uniref:Caskin-1 n=1 Tax=Steinernema hermaphroditum TaxID=289476 RepID=A0AA39H1F2_9BILA|nr:hypothetical protein QR680_002140 [Steinernema hermaphroditum]